MEHLALLDLQVFFYRMAWDIICVDLIAAIQFCWFNQEIPSGLNSNFLVLPPKSKSIQTYRAEQFLFQDNYQDYYY